jgi:hypothetical protein
MVEGIEFRAVTVLVHKGQGGPCLEHKQALIESSQGHAVFEASRQELARQVADLKKESASCGRACPGG